MPEYARAMTDCIAQLRDEAGVTLKYNGFTLTEWQQEYVKSVADSVAEHQRRHAGSWTAALRLALGNAAERDQVRVTWQDPEVRTDGSDGSRNRSH